MKHVKFCYLTFYLRGKVDEIIGKAKNYIELFHQQYSLTLLEKTSNNEIESSQSSIDVNKGNVNVVKIILDKNKEY